MAPQENEGEVEINLEAAASGNATNTGAAGGWLEEAPAPARPKVPPRYTFVKPHWFAHKALQISAGGGRRPETALEWAHCAWNADIFCGPIPFLKTLAAVSLVLQVVLYKCR